MFPSDALLFYLQVTVLRSLRHPSVVSLLGVSIQPRAIVLELAPLGSMATVLKGKSPLDKMVQHRIALQVLCYWYLVLKIFLLISLFPTFQTLSKQDNFKENKWYLV